jgi:pimeloyl-ACP methyl ester carboxylesterase
LSRLIRFRIFCAVLLLTLATSALAMSEGGVEAHSPAVPSNIVVGFVGGFVRHDNPHHGPVKLAQRIQRTVPKDTFVQVFENRHRRAAYQTILGLLDADHNGVLSEKEKAGARIVLFGHSWGASAVVLLARELDRVGIPVMLTVQVDSVAKPWQDDSVVPRNVAAAVNFYQPHGIIHGRSLITAADASKTQILGNYRFDYRKDPVPCEGTSWGDRFFTSSHIQSECDPKLWTRVEELVRQRLDPQFTTAVSHP